MLVGLPANLPPTKCPEVEYASNPKNVCLSPEGFTFDDLKSLIEYLECHHPPDSEHRITLNDKAYRLILREQGKFDLASIQRGLFEEA